MTPGRPGAALAAGLALTACPPSNVHSDSSPGSRPTAAAAPPPAAEASCPKYAAVTGPGTLTPAAIVEASGLAVSRKSPGVLWTHNDSDEDGPFAYAFAAADARYLGRYALLGAKVHDWEDMAIGPGADPKVDALYLGDIGDNDKKRDDITVYRVPEPAVDLAQAPGDRELAGVETLVFTYPHGKAHNAETLLVDPVRGDLCIVTKRKSGESDVYCAAAPLRSGELEHVAELDLGGLATGGAVSLDGSVVAVRTYLDARLWRRDLARPLADAFRDPACPIPVVLERQGEALAFTPDALGYYTVSEGRLPALHAYRRQ